MTVIRWLGIMLLVAAMGARPSGAAEEAARFRFGLMMVGPYNDRGWSQAHYEAGKYVESRIPGTEMVYIDKVNPADRPGVTVPQLADDLVEKGCKLVIANSDDMEDGITEAAKDHPSTYFIHVSGDQVLAGSAPKNLSNVMGRMEYGKMMAGFAAALTTKTGKIGYLGPIINEETRRLAASCYLGAKYAWTRVLQRPAKDLSFRVTWIGFWFNIPGVTSDPNQVAQTFFNSGYDVLVSGIDTTEAVTVAQQKRREGKEVWAVPYNHPGACEGVAESCLGVPFFNWRPAYVSLIRAAMAGNWKSVWLWLGPDWADLNNRDTSTVGFLPGPAMSARVKASLQAFVQEMASGKVNLFQGPMKYQDGTLFLKEGEIATDRQIWYLPQLLEGMEGQSSAK